jgi:NADH-quinone oxidoreductase subunit M
MPGSANFVGEFLILLGVFKAKVAFAFFASIGVALAAVYMLRAFIRAMHNRVNPTVDSSEITFRDLGVLAPAIVVILALAIYPQFGLKKSETSVKSTVAQVQQMTGQLTADTSQEQTP